MRRATGFTLVEVTVAVVLTGLVALLVYGAARTAADTRATLESGAADLRARMAWRAIVASTVRNVRSSADRGGPTLWLVDGLDGLGRPTDRLTLVTAGTTPPLTGDADWTVSFMVGPGGLVAEATPMMVAGAAPRLVSAPPGFTGLEVEALGRGAAGWSASWDSSEALPRALRITFWTDSGPTDLPLLLTLPPGSVP